LKASKGIQSYEISIWAAKAEYDDDIETLSSVAIFHKMSVLFLQKKRKNNYFCSITVFYSTIPTVLQISTCLFHISYTLPKKCTENSV
jgi:hypothetical protein